MSRSPESATELACNYRAGQDDPIAALERALARLNALDPAINAMTAMNPNARQEARASAVRWHKGRPLSPLDGVPVTVKDNLVAAGMPASYGTAALADEVMAHDEAAIATLRGAGLIVLGKTNVPEFCLEGYTANPTFGVTTNPRAPGMTPGGSSGGAAASVAAGVGPLAIGTDGGGSLRRPAGLTGLWTLKPGLGRIPRDGSLAQFLLDFEIIGGLAKTLEDLRALNQVWGIEPSPVQDRPISFLAIDVIEGSPVDQAITERFAAFCDALADRGYAVRPGKLPFDNAALAEAVPLIGSVSLSAWLSENPRIAGLIGPSAKAMVDRAKGVDLKDYETLIRTVLQLRLNADALLGADLILTPVNAAPPWPANQTHPQSIDGQAVGPRGHAVFTGWVNALGLPALALPLSVPDHYDPVGAQVVGRRGSEGLLLAIAAEWVKQGLVPS